MSFKGIQGFQEEFGTLQDRGSQHFKWTTDCKLAVAGSKVTNLDICVNACLPLLQFKFLLLANYFKNSLKPLLVQRCSFSMATD